MSYSSQFHMPGAYHFENPSSAGSGLNAGIFRPPLSPSASSSVLNLAKSTGSLCSDTNSNCNTPSQHAKRKRARDDANRRDGTPLSTDWSAAELSHDLATPLGPETPFEKAAGGIQHRYVLAGQIETPGGQRSNPLEGTNMEDSVYSDVDYRRALGSKKPHESSETPSNRLGSLRLDTTPQTPRSPGWGSFAFSTIGGVVGKVWDFCKGGAFRGFYAGGGKGYEWNADDQGENSAARTPDRQTWDQESAVPVFSAAEHRTPGAFPDAATDFPAPDFRDVSPPEATLRPAAKRRQISENGDELRKNWVMVTEKSNGQQHKPQQLATVMSPRSGAKKERPSLAPQPSPRQSIVRPGGPVRRISIPVSRLGGTPTGHSRRPSARISHAGSPALHAREPASFAPPRSPVMSGHRSPSRTRTFSPAASHTRLPMPPAATTSSSSSGQQAAISPNPFAARAASPSSTSRPSSRQSSMPAPFTVGSGNRGHRRSASIASGAGGGGEQSPRLDAEAQRLAARKRAAERDADARMDAFSVRLRDMIRQGKEALGTTVEVDGEADGGAGGGGLGGDEGWLDDE